MRQSAARDALRRIADVVGEATGRGLDAQAERRIAEALERLSGEPSSVSAKDSFAEREVTLLLADLRGFTALSAAHPAAVVVEVLNRCFIAMTEVIVRHGGVIDKFMGDAFLVVFPGDPARPGEDACRAVECAVDMQLALKALNAAHRGSELPALYLGIGVHSGRVIAGLLGSERYSTYTVIGEAVNLTARIEAYCLRGQVLVSESTYERCGGAGFADTGEPMGVYVKGRSEGVVLREVHGLPALGKTVPRQELRRSPRVDVRLPFAFRLLEGKIVLPQDHAGMILDIGYHGALIELPEPEMPLRAELRLEVPLPLVDYRATDLYARVVNSHQRDGRRLYGVEFTSLGTETDSKIQLFVQMLIQGSETD